MENTEKRKALLFIRVEPHEIYFARYIHHYRYRTLEIYCQQHNIEIVACQWIIGQYQSFEKDFLPVLRQNIYGFTTYSDLLLMHDLHELAGISSPFTLTSTIKRLGLDVLFIKDFAMKIGRY